MDGFKLVNGDIAIMGDGNVNETHGHSRLEQELTCWLLEPIGTDELYPGFGSKLHEFVGMPSVYNNLLDIKAEVVRVVNNYVEYQKRQVDAYRNSSETTFLNVWDNDDLISSVRSVDVSAAGDTVIVEITIITASNREVTIAQTI